MSSFAKGDVVTLRGIISYNFEESGSSYVSVAVDGYHGSVYVKQDFITLVHRGFEVGERVWFAQTKAFGHIRAIRGGTAWIERESEGGGACDGKTSPDEIPCYFTVDFKHLERAPKAAAEAA